ncbi:MAG: hypothetical protein ACJAWV_004400, partial [Flammeovirgaceae bacterium]
MEFAEMGENVESELIATEKRLLDKLDALELRKMLGGEEDAFNAIIEIN